MKKDYIQDLLAGMIYKRKKRLEEAELMKKKYKSLSLVERNAFDSIMDRKSWNVFWIVFAPFYAVFYIGLYGLVMKYAFNIDLLILLKTLALSILSLFPICILIFFIFLILSTIEQTKLEKKLLLGETCGRKI